MSDFGIRRDRSSYEHERYTFSFGCKDCGHKWSKTMATADPYNIKTPACPKCKKKRKERDGMNEILSSGRPPGIVGANPVNRALDMTQEMVAEDYSLTNLKDPTQIRAGESQVPLIHPTQQRMADNFFSPRKALKPVGMDQFAPLIARGALAGNVSPKNTGSVDPIAAAQAGARHADLMSRTTILNEKKGGNG